MENSEPEPSDSKRDSLSEESHLRTTKIYYFFFLLFCTQYTTQAQSTEIDSSQAAKIYQEITQKTDCAGILSPEEFYRIYYSYPRPTSSHTHSHSYESRQDTIYIYKTDTLKGDTIFRNTHTRDTIKGDTVLVYQELPTQQDIKAAKQVLQQVIEDKDLTDLIKETVASMSSEEIKKFRQELRDDVRNIDQQLRQERANRIVIELGGKQAKQKLAKQTQREARDSLSKTEKKELIKAKVALIAEKTGASFGDGAAALSNGLATIGNVIAKGIIAIGQGIINTAKAIWSWLGNHFSIHIDLSCAQQRKIKKHRQTMAVLHKHQKTKVYKGSCPNW